VDDIASLEPSLDGASRAIAVGPRLQHRSIVVAIPVRDEAERIGACVLALARQTVQPDAVVLLLNNCTDRTELVARGLSVGLPYELRIIGHEFPPAAAHAGPARRLAMQHAADLAGSDGILITTDADSVVAENWVELSLRAIAAGADVVCGRVDVDPIEAALIPAHLHADDARERELTNLLDEIAYVLDPRPEDPWPRHTEAAGASLAVTVSAFNQVGGIPPVPAGEDRAFVTMLARMDARIRHDPAIRVTVSGRTDGRAAGGMADAIRRRMRQQDEFADVAVEPAADAYRRADFRRRVRLAWRDRRLGRLPHKELATDLGIPGELLRHMLEGWFFGTVWAEIEASSPFLVRRRVRFVELPKQIAYATQLLERHD
jgi:hypothetical protein